MQVTRGKLEKFAVKYKDDIKKYSEFRKHFQEMYCAVDMAPFQKFCVF